MDSEYIIRYAENAIVKIAARVIVVAIFGLTWFNETPNARMIKENSEIWPSEVPTRKFVLLVYPNAAIKLIKTNGLIKLAIMKNITAKKMMDEISES